jgi:hypothetical protein
MNSKVAPPKQKGIFARIREIPSRMSLQARAAAVTAIFLLLLIAVVWGAFLLDRNNIPWRHAMTYQRIFVVIGSGIMLPWLVYKGLQLWLEGDQSRFPDIDFAWNAGVRELEDFGLSLGTTPLFVVAGSQSCEQEQALMQATGMNFRINGVPEGPAPLHWYAHPGGIFLFLSETCQLSALAVLLNKRDAQPVAAAAATDEGEVEITSRSSAEVTSRLEYVCELMKRARRPLCPCNGMLVLLPFGAFKIQGEFGEKFERLVRSDLVTMQDSLQVRCPVMSLIVGMENESGFRELVRRIGVNRAQGQRFGMGFDVRSPATADELSLLAAHISGRFEDWVYTLFREPGSLSRPGNRHLFALLCQVRSFLQVRLASLLAKGFGYDTSVNVPQVSTLFCGCYFAAVGDSNDRQAFVKGAVEKLMDEHENVEWTRDILAEDRRYVWMANVMIVLNAVLFVSLVAVILRRFTA